MKKLILSILIAAAAAAAGCDTIETRSIRIGLGGDRGTSPPEFITRAHIAIFTETTDGRTAEIDRLVFAKSVSASGYIDAVVPARRDLYILIAAVADTGNFFVLGEAEYLGESEPEEAMDTVFLYPDIYYIDSLVGFDLYSDNSTYVELTHDPGNLSLSSMLRSLLTIRIDRGNSPDSYKRIASISYQELIYGEYEGVFREDFPDGLPAPSYYRSRLYIPALNLYLFTWGEGSAPIPM